MDPDDIDEFLHGFGELQGQRPFMNRRPFGFPFDDDVDEEVEDGMYYDEDEDEEDEDEGENSDSDASATLPGLRTARISIEDDILTFNGDGEYGDVGVFQATERPFSSEFCYYEVEILDWGTKGRMGIGLAHSEYSLRRQPGWEPKSVAYHCDDGRLFQNSGFGRGFAAPSEVGDVIGCGAELDDDDDEGGRVRKTRVFFTRNGTEIGSSLVNMPPGGFYPTVGLHSVGESVRINLGASWPPEQDDEMVGGVDQADPIGKWTRLSKVIRKDGLLCYTGLGQSDSDGGIALSSYPLTPYSHYFEVEIVDSGDKGYVAIGIARKDYPTCRHPGWNPGSVAYHADDGQLFQGEGMGQRFGPGCHQGDRMGCGVKFLEDDDDDEDGSGSEAAGLIGEDDATREGRRVEVYFTRNGKKIGKTEASVPKGGFYPIIGMLSRGEKVRPDLNAITG
eukprot:m.309593 g.309593  ORF g.309593 m.309593 type:complete len:448 (+) comp47041_c0_seq1:91-1434(+)